jgi:hypothetical protein
MNWEDDAVEGNRNDRYRSVKALAFGDGPRKSYLVSLALAPSDNDDSHIWEGLGI